MVSERNFRDWSEQERIHYCSESQTSNFTGNPLNPLCNARDGLPSMPGIKYPRQGPKGMLLDSSAALDFSLQFPRFLYGQAASGKCSWKNSVIHPLKNPVRLISSGELLMKGKDSRTVIALRLKNFACRSFDL